MFSAVFIIIEQQFVGGLLTMQYGIEMTLLTFPVIEKSFPMIIQLIGIFGSIASIQLMRKFGRK